MPSWPCLTSWREDAPSVPQMSICWRCSNFWNPSRISLIFQVVKAGTMLGLSLGKLQLGSRREKVLQEEEKIKFELHKIRSWHWEWESILLGRRRLWSSLGKRSSGHKQITCQALALALYLHNLSSLIQILAKTLEPVRSCQKECQLPNLWTHVAVVI